MYSCPEGNFTITTTKNYYRFISELNETLSETLSADFQPIYDRQKMEIELGSCILDL